MASTTALIFRNIKQIFVDISQNPLICDCSSLDFFRYQSEWESKLKAVQFMARTLRCSGPEEYKGRQLVSMNANDIRCSLKEIFPDAGNCTREVSLCFLVEFFCL